MSGQGAPYARVCTIFWEVARRRKWPNDTVMMGLYLLTCSRKRTEGLFSLPLGHMLADLPSGWTPSRIRKALGQLEESGFAIYDKDAEVILITSALKYQSTTNPKHITAAIRKLAELPDSHLWPLFLKKAKEHAPGLYEAVENNLPHVLGYGMAMASECHPLPQALALTQAPALAPALTKSPTPSPTQAPAHNSSTKTQAQTQDSYSLRSHD